MFDVTYRGLVVAYLTLQVYHQENNRHSPESLYQHQPAQFE